MNPFSHNMTKTAKQLVFDGTETQARSYRRQLAQKINAGLSSPVDYSDQLKQAFDVLLKVIAKTDQA
jgi:hypothetical protein